MLNEGMDPNAELPVPVPVAFQKRFTDERLRYYLSSERGFTALMLATALGNHKFVDILLSAGADPWKLTKRHKTYALWLAAKYKNIEIMRSLRGIGANHESRAFRITIDLSEQKAFLWRNRRIELVTPFAPGRDPILPREDDISLPTNTGIPPRTAVSACLRDLREGFMPQCQSERSSKSSKELLERAAAKVGVLLRRDDPLPVEYFPLAQCPGH